MSTIDPAIAEQLRQQAAHNEELAARAALSGPPQDLLLFMSIFQAVLSGLAQRGGREDDNISNALHHARLAVGQFVLMGICHPQTKLSDGTLLAKIPNAQQNTAAQQYTGPQTQGNFSHQHPTLPQQRVTT